MDPSYNQPLSSNAGDIVIGSAPARKSKKPLAIIIAIIILLLIGGGVIWFFSSRSDAKAAVEKLYESLGWAFDESSQCQDLISYANNISVKSSEYDWFATECINEATMLRDGIAKTYTIFGFGEYPALQKTFADEFNSAILVGEKLNDAVNIYQTWHKWRLSSTNPLLTATDHDLENTAKILTDSGNETLAKFGTDWLDARKKLLNVSVFAEINPASADIAKAQAEYTIFLEEKSPNLAEITGLTNETDYSNLASAIFNLYNYVEESL